jgi:uncharacterized protein (DUF1697 family)
MGYDQVSAFLASGNVLFECGQGPSAAVENRIEQSLESQLGYAVPTFVRSAGEVSEMAQMQPFPADAVAASAGKLQVAVLATRPTPATREAALVLAARDDLLSIDERVLYWLPKGNMSDSVLDMKALARILGPMTIRTQRTMARLAAKLAKTRPIIIGDRPRGARRRGAAAGPR